MSIFLRIRKKKEFQLDKTSFKLYELSLLVERNTLMTTVSSLKEIFIPETWKISGPTVLLRNPMQVSPKDREHSLQ